MFQQELAELQNLQASINSILATDEYLATRYNATCEQTIKPNLATIQSLQKQVEALLKQNPIATSTLPRLVSAIADCCLNMSVILLDLTPHLFSYNDNSNTKKQLDLLYEKTLHFKPIFDSCLNHTGVLTRTHLEDFVHLCHLITSILPEPRVIQLESLVSLIQQLDQSVNQLSEDDPNKKLLRLIQQLGASFHSHILLVQEAQKITAKDLFEKAMAKLTIFMQDQTNPKARQEYTDLASSYVSNTLGHLKEVQSYLNEWRHHLLKCRKNLSNQDNRPEAIANYLKIVNKLLIKIDSLLTFIDKAIKDNQLILDSYQYRNLKPIEISFQVYESLDQHLNTAMVNSSPTSGATAAAAPAGMGAGAGASGPAAATTTGTAAVPGPISWSYFGGSGGATAGAGMEAGARPDTQPMPPPPPRVPGMGAGANAETRRTGDLTAVPPPGAWTSTPWGDLR